MNALVCVCLFTRRLEEEESARMYSSLRVMEMIISFFLLVCIFFDMKSTSSRRGWCHTLDVHRKLRRT